MKILSFAIPCYNSAEYMEKCIKSVLTGGEDVEIIIVDDGSSKDNTAKIADKYAEKFPTIVKAVHQENGGHGQAVNTGLLNATGKYFKVVDSDDWVETDMMEVMLQKTSGRPGEIIFFNFLNKCNRYNIYCVSYYKGNLGKESCTYMKAYKKIISFILTLVMMLSLSVNVFAAEPLTDDPNMIEWKYTVFADESLQKVVEEGVIPNAYARYTWRGITLKNGEVAILTPSNNSMGLYCNSGRYITINYTLSRSAFHRSRVRAYVAGPSSEFVREITASGLRSGFTTQATDYYYGMVTNLSSDAFTIKSFSITF